MPFDINISKVFLLLLVLAHLAAFIILCMTDLAAWQRLFLAMLVAASLIYHFFRYRKNRWKSLMIDQGRLNVVTFSNEELTGRVLGQTVVTPCCIALCAKFDGHRNSTCQVIFFDAMHEEAFRELRVRLRFSQ